MSNLDFPSIACADTDKLGCVVKLSTSYWYSKGVLNQQRSLRVLKKQSDIDFVHEEVSNTSPCDTWDYIDNINECEDGIYYLVYHGRKDDYSGDWDGGLKLIKKD